MVKRVADQVQRGSPEEEADVRGDLKDTSPLAAYHQRRMQNIIGARSQSLGKPDEKSDKRTQRKLGWSQLSRH